MIKSIHHMVERVMLLERTKVWILISQIRVLFGYYLFLIEIRITRGIHDLLTVFELSRFLDTVRSIMRSNLLINFEKVFVKIGSLLELTIVTCFLLGLLIILGFRMLFVWIIEIKSITWRFFNMTFKFIHVFLFYRIFLLKLYLFNRPLLILNFP